MSARVRKEPVHVAVAVPDGDTLLAWAADPHKRLAAAVVFKNATGGMALETLVLKAAYCVSYQETFVAGDAQDGAYTAHLVLSDPDGFVIKAGGPGAAFVAPAAREHGVPGVAVAMIQQGSTALKKGGLRANTPEHKATRWAEYQAANATNPKAWTQARWEKQYDVNMRNASGGLAREREYAKAMNAESKTLKTPLTFRQIDMFIADEKYCGQLKTGKMSLNKQARLMDIPKDAALVKRGYEVGYILEKGASKPFLDALTRAGVAFKIGPQIP